MAKKKKKTIFEWPAFRLMLTIASAILTTLILMFSTLTILEIYNNSYEEAPRYLIWIFFLVGLIKVVLFLKDRSRINLIGCIVLLIFNITLGVIVLFAKTNPFLFSLTAGLYCLTIVLSRIFDIFQKPSPRNIVFNGLIILFAVAMGVGIFITPIEEVEQVQNVILTECVFIAIVSFVEAASLAFAQLKVKVLFKIIVNTYSLEVLFGLLTMIVCFSLVFLIVEPAMATFPDALWYCFAVVTTIGFGDIVAVTAVGRILTVILGLYGLIVVAVITSIIVNFYNETSGKHDQKELKEIKKEENSD